MVTRKTRTAERRKLKEPNQLLALGGNQFIREVAPESDGRALREVAYTCAQCGAHDTVKLYTNEATPPAINCWKCKAGYNRPIGTMLEGRIGMFPLEDVPLLVGEQVN